MKFRLPGQIPGTTVNYYFAIQDSSGSACVTFPRGGSGVNPPGTTPPQNTFRYDIYLDNNQCSNTLPKPINDFQYTYDTIAVNQPSKSINKIKVNLTIYHPNDGDLIIQLLGPNGPLSLTRETVRVVQTISIQLSMTVRQYQLHRVSLHSPEAISHRIL